MKIYIGFIVAASKRFFRRKSSIFWTLFFPVVIMLALGNFNFGAYSAPNVGLINNSTDQAASNISNALLKTSTIVVKNLESIAEGDAALEKGSIVAYIEIPDNFIKTEGKIEITTREGDKPELELVQNVVFVALSNANNTASKLNEENAILTNIADIRYQGYTGFLVAGIVGMAIMQSGIFTVVFTLLSYKNQGVLRRLRATPISPAHFIVGHLVSRVFIIVCQTALLLAIGAVFLGVSIGLGNVFAYLNIFLMAILGGILFLSIGLAISSASPNEDSAPALANLVTFPMLFLSGVFFPIDYLPKSIYYFCNLLPLTHVAEGIRLSVLYGYSTLDTLPQLGYTFIWMIIAFAICAKTFKWE